MLKQTITYRDFNGKERTEDHWFNISKSEAVKLGITTDLERISRATNGQEVMDTFEKLMRMGYGIRSVDGSQFIKNDRYFDEFQSTGAYDQLFMDLVTDADFGAKFCNEMISSALPTTNGSVPTPEETMRRSESARKLSEAQFQGHLQKELQTVVEDQTERFSGRNQFENNSNEVASTADPDFLEWKRKRDAGEL